ncbi:MAG TPA: hypothetical protein VNO34_07935, partial [Actinomycetota bacterium]|nr:hypothetical protein [Actinomycetota bacterium]
LPPSPTPSSPPAAGPPAQPAGPLWVAGEDLGWAVVDGALFATDDGGASWSLRYGGPARLSAVQFVDATRGWALTPEGLLRTEDGGATWEPVAVPGPVEALCVAPGAEGATLWVAGARSGSAPAGVVLRSTDGGSTWQPRALSLPEGPWALELRCAADGGWVLARDGGAAGHEAFGLLRVRGDAVAPVLQEPGTHPFGTEGVPPAAGPYAGPLVALGGEGARFVTWCPPCEGGPTVMLTDDGGATWRTVQLPGELSSAHVPVGMAFLDRDRGWLLLRREGPGRPGLLAFRTGDGGRTWTGA